MSRPKRFSSSVATEKIRRWLNEESNSNDSLTNDTESADTDSAVAPAQSDQLHLDDNVSEAEDAVEKMKQVVTTAVHTAILKLPNHILKMKKLLTVITQLVLACTGIKLYRQHQERDKQI